MLREIVLPWVMDCTYEHLALYLRLMAQRLGPVPRAGAVSGTLGCLEVGFRHPANVADDCGCTTFEGLLSTRIASHGISVTWRSLLRMLFIQRVTHNIGKRFQTIASSGRNRQSLVAVAVRDE
jgi:hypothetical protein